METNNTLTQKEVRDRDRLLVEAKRALLLGVQAMTKFGRSLGEIIARRLYRQNPTTGAQQTVEQFAKSEYGHCVNWIYERIWFAEVNDDLEAADVEPLTALYQAAIVLQVRHPEAQKRIALRAETVNRARRRATGSKPSVEDFEAARDEVLGNAVASVKPVEEGDRQRETQREAVRAHSSLLVTRPARSEGQADDVIASLPGYDIIPFDDGTSLRPGSKRSVDAVPFTRSPLDEIAALTWGVLVSDPWTASTAWTLNGESHAILFPDRLSSPLSRGKTDADDRSRTVLVAPGVDLLHPSTPQEVSRAVVRMAGADSKRRYLVLTQHPDRVWAEDWPANVWIAMEATGTEDAVTATVQSLSECPAPSLLIVRDLREPITADLHNVWVLARGARTTQEAYDSLCIAAGRDRIDRGDEVKARHSYYPPTTTNRKASARTALLPSDRPIQSVAVN